jgi:midasin (ATPase involved in ribosome maturation)
MWVKTVFFCRMLFKIIEPGPSNSLTIGHGLACVVYYIQVGQIAVVSFGETFRLLHAFDQPFTEQAGAYALSSFTFAQTKTQWPRFLETAVTFLEDAKAAAPAGGDDHLQLMFVLSDAQVQQDRELVARYASWAVALVFVFVCFALNSKYFVCWLLSVGC